MGVPADRVERARLVTTMSVLSGIPPLVSIDRVHRGGRALGQLALVLVVAGSFAGCSSSALEQLTEARRISADLLVQFTTAADRSNRAVMADTDETSVAFAREAEQAASSVQKDADSL